MSIKWIGSNLRTGKAWPFLAPFPAKRNARRTLDPPVSGPNEHAVLIVLKFKAQRFGFSSSGTA